ncbi:hypothetical protein D3C87_545380 [compost metagenome]
MKPVPISETLEFDSRDDLEKAYFQGKLHRGQSYHVKNKNATYRLSVCRKGFIEMNNTQR